MFTRCARGFGHSMLAAAVVWGAFGSPVHADRSTDAAPVEVAVGLPPVPPTSVEVAVGLPPVPPTTVEVAVGLPPVPPTTVEVAVGLPPVPPTTVEVAVGLPPVPPTSVEVAVGLPPVPPLVRSEVLVERLRGDVDPHWVTDLIADVVDTVAAGLALIDGQF